MADFADISNNQADDPDWRTYAKSHSLIGLKASEGIGFHDGTFDRRWAAAKKTGLSRWAYHFANAGIGGEAQADFFLDIVEAAGGLSSSDMIALDMEGQPAGSRQWAEGEAAQVTKDFVKRCAARGLTRGVLYTGQSFRGEHGLSKPKGWLWWIASYGTDLKPEPCDFWQFTSTATVSGISTPVDYSHAYIDLEDDMTPEEIRAAVKPLIDDLGKVLLAQAAGGKDDPTHYGFGDVKRDLTAIRRAIDEIGARVQKLEEQESSGPLPHPKKAEGTT